MTGVHAAVFKAIHEGKWLTIEYRNRNEQTTRYWIAIRELRLPRGVLVVDGLYLGQLTAQARDRKKEAICREHGFELIRVENSYARRYHYIKDILIRYFGGR